MVDSSLMFFILTLYCSIWSFFLTGTWRKIVALTGIVALVEGVLNYPSVAYNLDSIIGTTNRVIVVLFILVPFLVAVVLLWNRDRIRISREKAEEIALKHLLNIYPRAEEARIDTSVIQDWQKEQLVNGEWRIPTFAKAFKQSFRDLIVIDARTGKVKGHTLIE